MSLPSLESPHCGTSAPPWPKRSVKITCLLGGAADAQAKLAPEARARLLSARAAVPAGNQVQAIAVGPAASCVDLALGLRLRVLPAALPCHPGHEPLSWELAWAIRDGDLIHLLDPFCRIGELGMLLARLHNKPVCATARQRTDSLGASLDLLSLADAVVPADATPAKLAQVYARLLAGQAEAAA
jgi:hypothetical protein